MNPQRRHQVEEIFMDAVELEAARRETYLAAACEGDVELRRLVETLLRHDAARGKVAGIVFAAAEAAAESAVLRGAFKSRDGADGQGDEGLKRGEDLLQARIGSWRLLRELGRGGMGSVWLAEREDASFAQQVAIKLIRPGLESAQLLRRFEIERRILAGLAHPAIARFFDGGTSAEGRPYFVMEYVEGRPITEFAAELPVTRRLELFLPVMDAVAYAHRNLVVHRDLKPGNILVDATGAAKLLDFGIAKLLDADNDAAATVAGALAFSPEYASPEQVRGEPINTATDVYGLGTVLYELITGQKAQKIDTATPGAIFQAVCLETPPPPSQVPGAPRRELAGDLDAIVMKALRKESEQRYTSAAEMADDVRRYLAAEPVRARQGKVAYRVGLFVRRYRVVVVAALLVTLSLLGGLLTTTWQARRAERRFNEVRGLATRFLFDFDQAIAKLPGSTEARRMVVAAGVEHLDALLADASGDQGLQLELAQAFFRLGRIQGSADSANLGRKTEALLSFGKAERLAEALVEDEATPERLEILALVRLETAITLYASGERVKAFEYVGKGLEVSRRVLAEEPTRARQLIQSSLLLRLADLRVDQGEPKKARAALEEAVSFEKTPGATSFARLGVVSREMGDLEAAKTFFTRALERAREAPGSRLRATLCFLEADLARTLFHPDGPSLLRAEEAAKEAESSISCAADLVAADSKDVSTHLNLLEALTCGAAIFSATDPGRSLATYERAHQDLLAAAQSSPNALDFTLEHALIGVSRALPLLALGRPTEALDSLRAAQPVLAARLEEGGNDARVAEGFWRLHLRSGEAASAAGQKDEAIAAFRRARELAQQASDAKPLRPMRRFFLAESDEALGRGLLASRALASQKEEATRLVAEAIGLWRDFAAENLDTSYAETRIRRLLALQEVALKAAS